MKNNIPSSVLVQIEDELKNVQDPQSINYARLSKLMRDGINCDDLARAIDLAWVMPVTEMAEHIATYDKSSPKMDAYKFIRQLGTQYGVTRQDVIFRIQGVRKIQNKLADMGESLEQYERQKNEADYVTQSVKMTIHIPTAKAMLLSHGYTQKDISKMNDNDILDAVFATMLSHGLTCEINKNS